MSENEFDRQKAEDEIMQNQVELKIIMQMEAEHFPEVMKKFYLNCKKVHFTEKQAFELTKIQLRNCGGGI